MEPPLPSSSWIVAELKVLVLLLIPALNPPRVDDAVMPSAATAARLATRAPLCLLTRCITAFPVDVGLVTTFLRSPIDTAPVFATGVCPVNSLKKTFDLTKDAIDLDHPGLTFGSPQGSPAGTLLDRWELRRHRRRGSCRSARREQSSA